MYARSIYALLLMVIPLLMIQFRCANPVTPEGGPKDTKPPEVAGCIPPDFSTHFGSRDIQILFNEFITLKSSGNEIIISPPCPVKPAFRLRGKSVIVDLKDSLARGTTYIINFGKAISDITEGNIANDFRYVFSTGDYIDSLIISGKVLNAFDNEPVPGIYAGLYTNSSDTIPFDSLPYLVPPVYITRTDENGNFVLSNLREDEYKLIILDDKSGDLVYNMPAERIAFYDTLIRPWNPPDAKSDSVVNDTVPAAGNTDPANIVLRLFDEIDSTQEVSRSELLKDGLFRIIFKFPTHELSVAPLNLDTLENCCLAEFSTEKDTILLFTLVSVPDSLILEIRDGQFITDTLIIFPAHPELPKRGKNEDVKPEKLGFSWNSQGNFNHLTSRLVCTLSYPAATYDLNGIVLISGADTLIPAVSFIDDLQRKIEVVCTWKEASSYKLLIPDSAFTGHNGISHDTVWYSFRTVAARELGSLFLNVLTDNEPGNCIIQLLTEKGKIAGQSIISGSGKVSFPFIAPARYHIKAIMDSNANNRWDTGDYLEGKQPEKVFYFPSTIEVRGNWEVEEEWKL